MEAQRQLQQLGWWEEALAQKQFERADWQGMVLQGADLTDANLMSAKLTHADLWLATLTHAKLFLATLTEADMTDATLTNAILLSANLRGATLTNADLKDADLTGAHFDERTILPDGTRWTPDTDMARFTYRKHPQFWRSDDPNSHAYGGG